VDVEDPARSRDHFHGGDLFLPLLENPRRQTGGVRARPSGNAVFDAHVVLGHEAHPRRAGQ